MKYWIEQGDGSGCDDVQRGRRLYLGNLGEVISDEDYMLHLEKKRKCRTLLISMARVNRGWRYDQFWVYVKKHSVSINYNMQTVLYNHLNTIELFSK